jgi:hypothetical protein
MYIHDEGVIAAIALDSNFNLRKGVIPFQGSSDSLNDWLSTLNIKANANGEPSGIRVLCYDQVIDVDKVLNDVKLSFETIDVSSIIHFINDNDGMHVRKISYPKKFLAYVAGQLKIDEPKGTWQQCMEIALIYKKLTERGVI